MCWENKKFLAGIDALRLYELVFAVHIRGIYSYAHAIDSCAHASVQLVREDSLALQLLVLALALAIALALYALCPSSSYTHAIDSYAHASVQLVRENSLALQLLASSSSSSSSSSCIDSFVSQLFLGCTAEVSCCVTSYFAPHRSIFTRSAYYLVPSGLIL